MAELEFRNQEFHAGRRRFGPWTWGHLADGFYGFRCPELRLLSSPEASGNGRRAVLYHQRRNTC
eukprot:5574477-Alexandrium_andersonii.AAC.1